ncbi:MAG: hypothetical protein Q8J86_00495, partial [Desulfurivibrionaceae bacterium]|nr:hypothetical protein [Desulfurivibrionaceae bacterium]
LSSNTKRAASSRNSFVYRPYGIFPMLTPPFCNMNDQNFGVHFFQPTSEGPHGPSACSLFFFFPLLCFHNFVEHKVTTAFTSFIVPFLIATHFTPPFHQ